MENLNFHNCYGEGLMPPGIILVSCANRQAEVFATS